MLRKNQRERETKGEKERTRERERSIWHSELVHLCAGFNLDSVYIINALFLFNTAFPRLCASSRE